MTGGAVAVARVGELVGGKYRIVRLLAEGGMGVVYEAQHTVVRRRFAVKFMRRDLAERRDILTRFQREAEAAGALESEHVAAAVDFGIAEDGAPYIVMEYLVGESLTALLGRQGPLPLGRAADLVSQAGRGMEVAHAAGIIHRDLKPQNLFVCRRQDGTDLLKVLDFGVAKLQTLDEMNMATRTGAVLGTVAYMSPEQARGDKVVDQRSDVYALGAILYELCSGRKPHPGESHNAILHHIATQPAVPLESFAPGLPVGFLAVVASALAADPAARPASAGALVEALAPFARREVWPAPKLDDSGAARVSLTPSSPLAEAPGIEGGAESARRARPGLRSRRRGPIVALSAGAIVAVVVVVLGVGRQKQLAALHEKDTPAAKPSVASSEQPSGTARPALTANAAPALNATAPVFHPLAGAGGSAAAHLAHRRPPRPSAASGAPSAAPAASAAPAGPAAEPPVPAVTFDSQNPYE
jgi:serine/threonine-protein kinase